MSETDHTTISRYFLSLSPAEEVEHRLDDIIVATAFSLFSLYFKLEQGMSSIVFLRRNCGMACKEYKNQIE